MIQIVYLFYKSDSTGRNTWDANGFPALREVLRILCNSGSRHPAHITQLLISALRQLNPVTPSRHISFKVHVNLFPPKPRSSLRPLPFKRSYQAHVHFSSIPCMLHAPHISIILNKTRYQYCVRSRKNEVHHLLFSKSLLPLHSAAQTFAQHPVHKPSHLDLSCIYTIHNFISIILCRFGGLGVACWPLVPKFAGSNPAEAVGFLGAKKSSARLPSEGK